MNDFELKITARMKESERKAWVSLKGYKFWMAGYHMAAWVRDNQLLSKPLPNPFIRLVKIAKAEIDYK